MFLCSSYVHDLPLTAGETYSGMSRLHLIRVINLHAPVPWQQSPFAAIQSSMGYTVICTAVYDNPFNTLRQDSRKLHYFEAFKQVPIINV